MKKYLSLLLLIPCLSVSQTFYKNYIKYEVLSEQEKTVKAIDVSDLKDEGGLIIPATVSRSGITYTVTEIKKYAFNDKKFTSVSIPNTVTYIGKYAFYNNDISHIQLGNGVKTIEKYAFAENNIRAVTIPDSVESIHEYAFWGNRLIRAIIGSSTTFIDKYAFSNVRGGWDNFSELISKNLSPSDIASQSRTFGDEDNIELFIPEGTSSEYNTKGWKGFKSVTEVATFHFFEKKGVTYQITSQIDKTVEIMDSPNIMGALEVPPLVTNDSVTYAVTSIGDSAFNNSNLYGAITLPEQISSIGEGAFVVLDDLTTVILKRLEPPVLKGKVFKNRSNINVIVPEGALEAYRTKGWMGFKSIKVEGDFEWDGITYKIISEEDKTVNIVGSVNLTGGLELLSTVENEGVVYAVTSIGNAAFSGNELTSVSIPNSVTVIGDGAFSKNKLTSVSIPNSVTVIGDGAFSANLLTEIRAEGSVPADIQDNSFGDDRGAIDLTIPEGTLNAYEAKGWTGFKSIQEDGTLGVSDTNLNKDVTLIVSDSHLTIKSSQLHLKSYAIYNMQGVVVFKGKENSVALSGLSKGTYIALLNFDKGTISKKFIN